MHKKVRNIAIFGMLLAIQVVAGQFCTIRLPIVSIGFVFLPLAINAMLFGPLWGGIAGLMGDFLVAMLGPYGYFPPMATTAFLGGLIFGYFFHNKKMTVGNITAAVLVRTVLCTLLLQTYWITMLSGKGYMALLPARIFQAAVSVPVQILCIRALAPVARCIAERGTAKNPAAPAEPAE